jgi:hypothetical protein
MAALNESDNSDFQFADYIEKRLSSKMQISGFHRRAFSLQLYKARKHLADES